MNILFLLDAGVLAVGVFLIVTLCYTAIISYCENENVAVQRSIIGVLVLPVPFFALYFSDSPYHPWIQAAVLCVIVIGAVVLLIPFNNRTLQNETPTGRIDERTVMFSRNELVPGTQRFDDYYREHPEHKTDDDMFRGKAGLMSSDSLKYNEFLFSSAEASFQTVSSFHNICEGEPASRRVDVDPGQITGYLKIWAEQLGALSVGVTELKTYHKYSHHGRGDRYGQEVALDHRWAVAFTVEMDKAMMDSAPDGTTLMESAQEYLTAGTIAVQLAVFIRELGYPATAHIDARYSVVCPLVARDAGLGELGRMGLLMTPELGPRVRIGVVTTDMPLVPDRPTRDHTMIDFCNKCKKCADICPSKAIPNDDRRDVEGFTRWQIDQESCFHYWSILGTDCGICMRICPYSHPRNFLHNFVRFGVRRSALFRSVAVRMDDLLYSRRPKPFKLPQWVINPKKATGNLTPEELEKLLKE